MRPVIQQARATHSEEPGLPTFSEVSRSPGCSEVSADAKTASHDLEKATRVIKTWLGVTGNLLDKSTYSSRRNSQKGAATEATVQRLRRYSWHQQQVKPLGSELDRQALHVEALASTGK